MIESNQFGGQVPRLGADGKACAHFDAMLTDAVDGLLTPEEQLSFDEHVQSCTSCSDQLAEARRGVAWLEMLKAHPPEPDAALLDRILHATSVRTAAEQEAQRAEQRAQAEQMSLLGAPLRGQPTAPLPAMLGSAVVPFRTRVKLRLRPVTQTVLQPRFMMTAAMAFFSVALTLNVTGVQLSRFRASDLKPSNLRRSFYQANAHVVRYYDNLRVVYELESRVHDLQRGPDDSSPETAYPTVTPETQPKQGQPAGTKDKAPEPTGKDPKGSASGRPDPRSGSSRQVFPAQQAVQVASASERAWPDAPMTEPLAMWHGAETWGRAE